MCCGSKSNSIRSVIYATNKSAELTTPPVFDVLPLISGDPYLNMQLNVSDGTVSGGGTMVITYQWRRNGVDIAGQTTNTYTMVTADTADSLPLIDCQVTATNEEGFAIGISSNSKLCTPVILMSCDKIGGSMSFAGSLTRKTSPSSVIIQWGDGSNSSVTTTITKTYGATGVKDIRVYSELNNIASFNVTTLSTRLVSFTATEAITSITAISITNQSTAGIFTTLAVKNLPNLATLTLTSAALTALTSTQIDNLPALNTLNITSMAALTNLTLPVLPMLTTINAATCATLSTVSINNNPSLLSIIFSRCLISSLDISALTELTTLTLGNATAGNTITTLDVTPNNKLVNINLENIQITNFSHGTLPDLLTFNIKTNNVAGTISLTSPLLVSFLADSNQLTSIVLPSTALAIISVNGNALTEFSMAGKTLLGNIDVQSNAISSAEISEMLADLVANGLNDGQFLGSIQFPAAPPNAQGLIDKATLESRGWFVDVDV